MAKVFLDNQYVDTLGVIVEVGKVINIRFMGEFTKAKVIKILDNGIMVELLD